VKRAAKKEVEDPVDPTLDTIREVEQEDHTH